MQKKFKVKLIIIFELFFILNSFNDEHLVFAVDLVCSNTHEKALSFLREKASSYKDKGFSVPTDIEMALYGLSNLGKMSYSVNLTRIDSKASGVTVFAIDGPVNEYSDYVQSCRYEVLSSYCKGGFVNSGFSVECKMESSGSRDTTSQNNYNVQGSGGGFYKDKNGVWKNH